MTDPAKPTRAPRRDAQARREALIVAAAASFACDGYGVALETIADRAGVGRGTLYRNFRDRGALALAIFSREIDRLEAVLDPAAPIAETIATMVRDGAAASALFTRIAVELHLDDPNFSAFQLLGERLERVVAPLVAGAKARGELDAAVTPDQLVLAMRMAGGLLLPFMDEAQVAARVEAALRMLLDGLRPR
ncbi:TetR family transcriptional regulator [Sphingomonas rubra]|uniref:Transcriptional regulator, TetR family n=1 Tax=Sphingomonas rubra TaxID=634430 RepID=A0A1I5RDW1_9SPHN|nr:TetR family transcriptional regulator [Sphingomonas rubra]SFP56719.1 transcriptional regulator, TetR family [Sphingomonas rubra]